MGEYHHWTHNHLSKLDVLQTYAEMREVALAFLEELPKPIVQVCGPITTGGRGSIEENIKAFGEAIAYLSAQGKIVFDQRPFEIPMQRAKMIAKKEGYPFDLLEEFYLPIFESKLIEELFFLPGWESSTGAKWEHEQAVRLGIKISYLPDKFI